MGNCVQSSHCPGGGGGGDGVGRPVVQLRVQRRRRSEKEVEMMEEAEHQGGQGGAPPPVVKMKMVLTKGELGWLVARLNAGDRRLEDVLHEMARTKQVQKRDAGAWRPSLESILECPAETTSAAADDS